MDLEKDQGSGDIAFEVQGFAVEPKRNCPHFSQEMDTNLEQLLKQFGQQLFAQPCTDCNDKRENWLCLQCKQIFCSRYIQGHLVAHNEKTQHCIGLSFADLSFWCYNCESYITNYTMDMRRIQCSHLKFKGGSMDDIHNLKTDEEKKEYFDTPEELNQKVQQLVQLIKNSKHFIAFTGAGVSTSTGIQDYRSGVNTVLKTGAGAWEELANAMNITKNNVTRVSSLRAIPSKSHMALVQLEKQGKLKFLISQNTDGLHLKSGFNPTKIAELHGNQNLEICNKCKRKYLRDYCTRQAILVKDHITGRLCDNPNCKGDLEDTIVNFGENLPELALKNGFDQSNIADLCMVLGSSLRVTPAANMPEQVGKRKNNLVIVNLQKTPLDKLATLKIHAQCDQVMELVMQQLNLEIPEFNLIRRFGIQHKKFTSNNSIQNQLEIMGLYQDENLSFSLFKSVSLYSQNQQKLNKEPFIWQCNAQINNNENSKQKFKLELEFQGHYEEPVFEMEFDLHQLAENKIQVYEIIYNPFNRQWISCKQLHAF